MQMVKKIFIVILLIWFTFIWFMPKKELYYKLEQVLENQNIVLNEKKIDESWFSLTLHQVDVYVKGIKLATIDQVNFFTLLFYSKVEIENLLLDESLKAKLPTQIDTILASHSAIKPLKVNLDIEGSIGKAIGFTNLKERHMRIDFNSTDNIGMLKSMLQQDEKGWYYETSF